MAKSLKQSQKNNRRNLLAFLIIFALAGGVVIWRGFAASAREYPISTSTPQIKFSVSPNSTVSGHNASLTWSSSGASLCSASAEPGAADWMGNLSLASTKSVKVAAKPTRYRLICEQRRPSGAGDISAVWHGIRTPGQANTSTPSLHLSSSLETIKKKQQVTWSWTTTGVKSCYSQSGYGTRFTQKKNLPASGSLAETISSNTEFKLDCADGNIKDTDTWNNYVMGMVEAMVK